MHKIQLNKCLGCCTVKRGGQIWGMIHMSLSFILLVFASLYMIYTEPHQEMLVFTPAIITAGLYLLFDLFLLIGISREKLNMILTWLIWNGSIAVCLLWYMLLIFIALLLTEPLLVLGIVPPAVYLCVETYFVVVVMSHYLNVKYPPGSVLYNPPSRRLVQQEARQADNK